MTNRHVSWFSNGIPSALTAKYTVEDFDAEVVYCDSFAEEHPDNRRFLDDCSEWIGKEIKIISSGKTPTEIFEERRYMSGIAGAPCTGIIKRGERHKFQHIDDVNCWGFFTGEENRAKRIVENEPEFNHVFPLIERGLSKTDCHELFAKTGIEIPMMYKLGFDNNNCISCVKAQSPKYHNMIRKHFPEQFDARAKQSREIGCRLVKVDNERIFLDELKPDVQEDLFEQIDCGVLCQTN
jgi:3'-phosphoadenosine 5'-phosphosulfate sulfotransferase (PAPS reductase)/FAD synthetase